MSITAVFWDDRGPDNTIEVSTAEKLGDVLAGMSTGHTIKLMQDITYANNVSIGFGRQITFDLNGKTLDIKASNGIAL